MPRAITAAEEREALLGAVRNYASYWSTQQCTSREMCDGLAFSILGLIDGVAAGNPSLDLVVRPHPDDKAYCEKNGENWHEDGLVINDGDAYLHDDYYKS